MRLTDLIEKGLCAWAGGALPEGIVIESLHHRSDATRPGGLFVAVPGLKADGHDYIQDAVARGARAIVVQAGRLNVAAPKVDAEVACVLTAPDTRRALAAIAAHFYGDPSAHMTLVGVTGTNGKTTVTYLVEQMMAAAGLKTGVIGTISYRWADQAAAAPMTTPEAADLQALLARMRADGVTHVAMEASSHALDRHRLDGCRFDVGIFTNLTQDHLDYHPDMQAYLDCKRRLFTRHLDPDRGVAVINRDHPAGERLARELTGRIITVGTDAENGLWPRIDRNDLDGLAGIIHLPDGGKAPFRTPLIGRHNVENLLCAAGAGVALGLPASAISEGIASMGAVPGRLEPIPEAGDRFVFVDYAHTPDALGNVLSALRPLAGRRIISVFGCGGDRDRAKRPLMGRIAAALSDVAVVTSDNPRSEAPLAIIDDILAGIEAMADASRDAPRGQEGPPVSIESAVENAPRPERLSAVPEALACAARACAVEPDRRRAIRLAIAASAPGDVVLIAGKGHETYQVLKDRTIDFDDRAEARAALSMAMKKAG